MKQKLEKVKEALEFYAKGGSNSWIDTAQQIGDIDEKTGEGIRAKEAVETIEEVLGELESEGWQSIKTSPHDKSVLICYGEPFFGEFTQEVEKAFFDSESEKWLFDLSEKEVSTNGVTHWMPLPEPPKQQ